MSPALSPILTAGLPDRVGAAQVEKITGVDRRTALYWAARDRFPRPFRVGSRWYWRADEVERWVAQRRAEARLADAAPQPAGAAPGAAGGDRP